MSGEEGIDESAVRGRTLMGKCICPGRGPAKQCEEQKPSAAIFLFPLSYSDEPTDIICGENPEQIDIIFSYLEVQIKKTPDTSEAFINLNIISSILIPCQRYLHLQR